jgi:homoserine dehydrogenase
MTVGVGIIGFGTVGIGTFKILREHRHLIEQRTGIDLEVVKIADVAPREEAVAGLDKGLLTADAREVINHKDIRIVVELIGGINPAFDYILDAARQGKGIVTANKALLAEKGNELFPLIEKAGSEIAFEAAVGGGIPVVRAIRDGLVGNRIRSIIGILNGTTNYILTKMTEEGVSFPQALEEAQRLGFAEKDPTFDVEGIDAAHKLCILARLAFRSQFSMEDIGIRGIVKLSPVDIAFAKEFGYVIKLLAVAKETAGMVDARVEPAMIPLSHPLSSVNGVFNAVYVVGDRTGPTLYYGRGAGSDPTGSAVVSDIVDMARRIGVQGLVPYAPGSAGVPARMTGGEEPSMPYYMRFTAQDRPGVLSRISGILAEYDISISTVIQRGREENGYVPIVILTHEARGQDLKKAKDEINSLPVIKGESVHIRIEEGNL